MQHATQQIPSTEIEHHVRYSVRLAKWLQRFNFCKLSLCMCIIDLQANSTFVKMVLNRVGISSNFQANVKL